MSERSSQRRDIRVVVPVYRDAQVTRACLESLLASELPDDTLITVINDASPDEALVEYCQALASEGRIELLDNAENLGFVGSANRGMALDTDRDVLLLNSDTRVAGDWLQRLAECAYRTADTGTVTPFSNNATICSYPVFLESSALPAGWREAQLHELFGAVNDGESAELPTGVGFCFYIRRDCLDAVGGFDEAHFGQGYGEECDFSLRAAEAGWHNMLAADVFVFHEGAVSFGDEEVGRKEQADAVMLELHPEYGRTVSDFCREDPLATFRDRVSQERLAQRPDDAGTLLSEQTTAAAAANRRAAAADGRVSKLETRLGEALEHNSWLSRELESVHQEAFDGREYKRLFEEANEELRKRDDAARRQQDNLEAKEAELADALERAAWYEAEHTAAVEKAAWFEKAHGEATQLANWREKEMQKYAEIASGLRDNLEATAAAQQQAEATLAEVRDAFNRTDEALGQTQALAEARQQELNDSQRQLADASTELATIKGSRVWRYTRWLHD